MPMIVPDFDSTHVLVVGDLMLDRYWYGDAHRISPEAPVPVLRVDQCLDHVGGAGNVALNLKAIGCKVSLLGNIGQDREGAVLLEMLQSKGIDCYLHQLADFSTIVKLRVIGRSQQLVRLDFEKSQDSVQAENLWVDFQKILRGGVQAVVLSDYAKGTLHQSDALIAYAKKMEIPVLVDPKGLDFKRYRESTLLTPNQKEFESVVGPCQDDKMLVAKGYALLRDCALRALLITRGERGMTLISDGEPVLHFPTEARQVYDVTGAGDTVIAWLAAGLATNLPLSQSIRWANAAAGLVVQQLGSVAVSKQAVLDFIASEDVECLNKRGIISENRLVSLLQKVRACNKKLVMTNGCFDILHAGHVQYLEQAKQLGDYLLVAVNSDLSVKKLKGASRPINCLEDRMAILAALRCVDWVVAFSEETPQRLIQCVLPDFLVKAKDYCLSEVAGSDIVLKKGGKVCLLDIKVGCATSTIIDKIRKAN